MIRSPLLAASILALACSVPILTAAHAQSVDPSSDLGRFRDAREQGMKALDARDPTTALKAFDIAETCIPDSPSILLLKAQAFLAENRKAEAHAQLVAYEKRGYVVDLQKNPDFAAVWDSDLDALQAANTAPVGQMHEAASVAGFMLGQGLAAGSDRLYLSGVRNGGITVVSAEGAKPLMTFRPGVAAYDMGMRDGNLWAATAASRQTKGFEARANVKSKIVVINPANGAIINTFSDPAKDRNFGHILMGRDDLYAADTDHGEILRLNGYAGKFQVLVPEGYFDSPGAMAENADASVLIVSDFIAGLYRVDLAKGTLTHLKPPADGSLLGLSQLARDGDDLIGVETGFKPNRVVRLHMAPDWSAVRSEEVLLRSDEQLAQPTAGLVEDGHFIFVARSQWSNLDDRGNALSDKPDPVVIGAIQLEGIK
jgi:hypothetical protein